MLADFVGGPMHGKSKFINGTPHALRFGKIRDVSVGYVFSEHAKVPAPDFDVVEYRLIDCTETFCVYYIHTDPSRSQTVMPPCSLVEHWIRKQHEFQAHLRDTFRPEFSEHELALVTLGNRKAWERAFQRMRRLKRKP